MKKTYYTFTTLFMFLFLNSVFLTSSLNSFAYGNNIFSLEEEENSFNTSCAIDKIAEKKALLKKEEKINNDYNNAIESYDFIGTDPLNKNQFNKHNKSSGFQKGCSKSNRSSITFKEEISKIYNNEDYDSKIENFKIDDSKINDLKNYNNNFSFENFGKAINPSFNATVNPSFNTSSGFTKKNYLLKSEEINNPDYSYDNPVISSFNIPSLNNFSEIKNFKNEGKNNVKNIQSNFKNLGFLAELDSSSNYTEAIKTAKTMNKNGTKIIKELNELDVLRRMEPQIYIKTLEEEIKILKIKLKEKNNENNRSEIKIYNLENELSNLKNEKKNNFNVYSTTGLNNLYCKNALIALTQQSRELEKNINEVNIEDYHALIALSEQADNLEKSINKLKNEVNIKDYNILIDLKEQCDDLYKKINGLKNEVNLKDRNVLKSENKKLNAGNMLLNLENKKFKEIIKKMEEDKLTNKNELIAVNDKYHELEAKFNELEKKGKES